VKTKLLELDHLVEACGDDPKRLASLALLLALAGVGLTASGTDAAHESALDQVLEFARVVRDLEARLKAAPH
jgi:hypothetical protein